MKILVLGCSGQVGVELMRAPWARGIEVTGLARPQFDITSAGTIEAALSQARPVVVVNAAAYTAVDAAETDEARAFAVNANGPAMLAQACRRRRIPFVHLSTDYVFDGSADRPYRESDPVSPINAYGRSKAAGELAVREHCSDHIILRTAWVYAAHGNNFVRTMLRLARERDEVTVVADQRGTPSAAADIAAALSRVVARIACRDGRDDVPWGTYHFTARGDTSWHGFARHIFERLARSGAKRPRLRPIASGEYPCRAARPANSRLDCTRIEQAFGISRPPWEEGLDRVLDQLIADGNRP